MTRSAWTRRRACTRDGDCCDEHICRSNGTCDERIPDLGACADSDDCCSELCISGECREDCTEEVGNPCLLALEEGECKKGVVTCDNYEKDCDPGPNENRPVTFVIWEVAQAFCIWDGGRLPTEAEWNYAAVGGDQQRTYPWGEQPPTPKLAALNYNQPGGPYDMADRDVGSVPAGAGRWGQLDLSGGRAELMFDANLAPACCEVSKLPVPCDDCLVLPDAAQEGRILRDQSAFHLANVDISNEERDEDYFELTQVDVSVGFRCVYVPEDN